MNRNRNIHKRLNTRRHNDKPRPIVEIIMPYYETKEEKYKYIIYTQLDKRNLDDDDKLPADCLNEKMTFEEINKIVSDYFTKKITDPSKTDFIVSDMHNVLDTLDSTKNLSVSSRMIALSYVGYRTKIYYSAINEICKRISNGQILFGVLCFDRTEEANVTGTKEYVIKNYIHPIGFKTVTFLDDSIDHIRSVASGFKQLSNKLNTNVICIQIKKSDNVEEIMNKL